MAETTQAGGVPRPENAEWERIRTAKDLLDAEAKRGPCDKHCADHATRIEIERATLATSHAVLWAAMDLRVQVASLADVVRQMQDRGKARLEWGKLVVPAAAGLVGALIGKWL